MFLIITLSIVFLQTHSSVSIELDRNRLHDSYFEEEILIESQPKAPFWLKPKQMEREVFAEPLNSQVSRYLANSFSLKKFKTLTTKILIRFGLKYFRSIHRRR